MLTEKDYCDYDTCVALKELGYVGSSRYYYTQRDHKFHYDAYNKFYTVRTADAMGYVLAIHLYEAQQWLREEKGICVYPQYFGNTNEWIHTIYVKSLRRAIRNFHSTTYENSLLKGIEEAIKILKDGIGE